MRDLMMLYGVTLGARYSKNQKEIFYRELSKEAKENNLEFNFLGNKKVKSICVGNLENSKYIFITSYDTPAVSSNGGYYPFNTLLNAKNLQKPYLIRMILLFILFVVYGLLAFVIDINETSKIIVTIISIVVAVMIYYFTRIKINIVNFNKNSAAIALLVSLMHKVQDSQVCYVFLDDICQSYESLKLLKNSIKNGQIIIHIDGIASGEKLLIAYHHEKENTGDKLYKSAEKLFDQRKEYRSSQNIVSYFPESVYISSGEIIDKQFYVPYVGTKEDYHVDIERLEEIHEVMYKFLKKEMESK